jgi:DNA polymerase V
LISSNTKRPPLRLPLYLCPVTAGFPSPAYDFLEKTLDINEYLIRDPASTFLVRASGDSMKSAGIYDGDMLLVDRSLQLTDGKVVIALVYGDFAVKTLKYRNGKAFLVPANANYPEEVLLFFS